jgi:GH35 family endo-1,4-beta-xylanase
VKIVRRLLTVLCCALCVVQTARAMNGDTAALKSSGTDTGSGWRLDDNGYVGTYITLASPGSVTVTVNASGTASSGVDPHMNFVIDDTTAGFDVGSSSANYQYTFDLPAGTHFVRTEFNNDPGMTSRSLTINSLNVSGASFSNSDSNTNALAAADTYISNYRKGDAVVQVPVFAPGTEVHVKQVSRDFDFGTAVGGFGSSDFNSYFNNSDYTSHLLENFNTIVPGNAGKWAYNEPNQNNVTMSGVDTFLDFAQSHNLDARMHNLIWGSQQPNWVNNLLSQAQSGNATAKAQLSAAITSRIAYYIGNGSAGDRDLKYSQLDVLNELYRNPAYVNVFGIDGIAQIYKQALDAVNNSGADTRLYVNEYNVLQFSSDPATGSGDPYANWYRKEVDDLNNAGYGQVVTGVGMQYYPFNNFFQPPAASVLQQVFANMSVTGLPLTLTEFGVQTGGGTTTSQAANYLEDAMRMVFGTPNATAFVMWGFWANDVWDQAPLAALYDANWNITESGLRYQQLMSDWTTDEMVTVNPDGTLNFNGFYGDYEITADGQTYDLTLDKGTTDYIISIPGDVNGDGTVNLADLNAVKNNFGEDGSTGGDANGDGVVNLADLNEVKNNFGDTASPGFVGVPEPASVALLLGAGAFLCNRRGLMMMGE